MRKTIITCAVTGSVHTPSMSPALPVTPAQITEQALAAAEAGAAVLHMHARDPQDGRPSPDPAIFEQFIPQIAARTDAIINITTGGSTRMTLDERLAYPLQAQPELCSLNMGSMNFSFHKAAQGVTDWQHDWEKPYVEGSEDLIFRNTFRDMKSVIAQLGKAHGTRFEFECYDVGHLYNLAYLRDEGLIEGPLFLQCVLGILGGLNADPENLFLMRSTADRLFGRDGYAFSVLGAGRHQMGLVTMGAIMGGHVRVGLEDSLYIARGKLAQSCAEQVTKVRTLLEALSLEIATPDEARRILATKGPERTALVG
ncbi:3-keto-5-aminohexanoate cleavage protein [Phaeobacter sp. PT47_59]|uniref:3-keto-5-aminohexanoate cleavage protein n=1 Tax=Phaeobacter sp. PT47_59 TaxID=3029979 RepID=UPI0023803657|nr:3-keto-5-aminohexanoate cleavage protein [Phaeobacter sp. PT47_59]MDE4172516.1 3-keto-5-aminohexanoate cleavage protein [Phaeobacter sp. PT47_59]